MFFVSYLAAEKNKKARRKHKFNKVLNFGTLTLFSGRWLLEISGQCYVVCAR